MSGQTPRGHSGPGPGALARRSGSVHLPLPDGLWRAGELAGLDPRALAAAHGTPLYVYDLDLVAARVRALRDALPAGCDVAYAVKANPSLAVVATIAAEGADVDVSSIGELEAARRAGVPGGRTVVTGPGKVDALLDAAVARGVRAVVVESPGELRRLERAAERAGTRCAVLLRLPAHEGQSFGMAWEDAVESGRRAAASPWLEPLGVHAFGVSAELDARVLLDHVERTGEAARRLAAAAGFPLRLVDAGGGLGIPYADDATPLDLGALGEGLANLLRRWQADAALRDVRLLLEPGRFMVGPAGAYVARVVDVKRLHGRHVATLDGGINHLLAPALVGRTHRLRLVANPAGRPAAGRTAERLADARPLVPVDIVGPLCTGLDVLARPDAFPEPRPGDLVVTLDVGAYGFTQSMPWFLSHPGPAEVAVRAGRSRLIRPRLDPGAVLDAQVVPGD